MMSIIQTREGQCEIQPKTRTKRSVACNYCRLKKVRCNGEQPRCANCLDRGEKCVYLPLRRRTRRNSHGSNEHMLDRIALMEAMLKEANVPLPSPQGEHDTRLKRSKDQPQVSTLSEYGNDVDNPNELPPSPPRTSVSSDSIPWASNDTSNTNGADLRRENYTSGARLSSLSGAQNGNEEDSIPGKLATDKGVSSVAPPQNSHWEYHGPGSFLSICSKPGMDWVAEKTGVSDFVDVARTFARDIARPLKLETNISPERAPEPDQDTAWRYCRTYFDKAPEGAYDIVNRDSFEARLHLHFERKGEQAFSTDDAAWYALRNTIYAFGCRYELGKASYSSTFKAAQDAGWVYFENALSRHTELTFCRNGIMAVQALVTMAIYVEGVGCPSLEYMLCAGAVRLAQSKGLHRQPGTAWNMAPQEIEHRNWIFWVVYTYEKHIAHRSGRASSIDDDDISCQLPSVPLGVNQLEFCIFAIKHAQISARIGKRFSTVQAYRQSPDEIIKTACELDAQLQDWKDSLPETLRPGSPINLTEIPDRLQVCNLIYLHYAYFGSLIAIHSTFTYPWIGMFGRGPTPGLLNQVKISTDIVAESSRSIILATKYVSDIYAWTPVWMAFYFPVLGLINLFVHVLKNPLLPTVQSDIALMDMVAGHFARLEFASSGQLAFSFGREMSTLARIAVKNAQKKAVVKDSMEPAQLGYNPPRQFLQYEPQHGGGAGLNDMIPLPDISEDTTDFDYSQMGNFGMADFDMENWSALLPSFSPGEMLNLGGMNDCDNFLGP